MITNIIQAQEEIPDVFIKGVGVTLPAGKVSHAPCKVKIGNIRQKRAMMFQPLDIELPEGIEIADTIILLKPDINNYFKIPIINTSKHDIVLKKNRQVGVLEYILSITPLEVEEKTGLPRTTSNIYLLGPISVREGS